MKIVRTPRPGGGYVVIENEVARDVRLSFRARGLLVALLSRPDDWRTDSETLAAESPTEGRDAIRGALREIEAAGYLVRDRRQGARGRFEWMWLLFDKPRTVKPQVAPSTDSPATAGPTTEQPPTEQPPTANPSSYKAPMTNTDNELPTTNTQTPAPPSGDAPQLTLIMADEAPPAPPPKPVDPNAEADKVTATWWESHTPRPAGSFVGFRNIVRQLVGVGWRPDDVAAAITRLGRSWTRAQVERELDRSAGRRHGVSYGDADRDGPTRIMSAAEWRAENA